MKRSTKFLGLALFLVLTSGIEAAVPKLINFQGILKDGSGNPVANGSYSVTFTIYDAPAGGTVQWAETTSVTTSGGLFTVLLGAANPVPDSAFTNPNRWLGIKVGVDPEMTPRQQLTSVGYAYESAQWMAAGANLFRLTGNVGIGTSNPGAKLTVNDNIAGLGVGTPGIMLGNPGGSTGIWQGSDALNYLAMTWNHPSYAGIRTGAGPLVLQYLSGQVGIGTTTPVNKLDVEGNVAVGFSYSGTYPAPANGLLVEGSVGIGTTTPAEKLTVAGSMEIGTGAGDYQHLRIGGGNNSGFLYGSYPRYGDGIHMGYNYYADAAGNPVVIAGDGSTSRLSLGYGYIGMYVGGIGAEPTTLGVYVNSLGNVGIGTIPTGIYDLDVAGAAHASSFVTSSDNRLKKNIEPLTDVLEKIEQIQGVSFDWNETYEKLGRSSGHREIGVIAQDVEKVFPELISKWGDENYRGVDYGRMTAVLIEAAKELHAENKELKALIQKLLSKDETSNEPKGGK